MVGASALPAAVACVGGAWRVLPARGDGWTVPAIEPLASLDAIPEASVEDWRQAWRAWCEGRGMPAADAEACELDVPQGHRLRVRGPAKLRPRGDEWLTAGGGSIRRAAWVEWVG